jgi:hypothetical protein
VRYAKRASDGIVNEEFTTIVRNNVFINIKDKITIPAEPVMNSYSENHKFYVYYNDFIITTMLLTVISALPGITLLLIPCSQILCIT